MARTETHGDPEKVSDRMVEKSTTDCVDIEVGTKKGNRPHLMSTMCQELNSAYHVASINPTNL